MTSENDLNPEVLKCFGLCLARFLTNHATDPHGYFEKQLVAKLNGDASADDIQRLITDLIEWVQKLALPEAALRRLDSELAAAGLEHFAVMQTRLLNRQPDLGGD